MASPFYHFGEFVFPVCEMGPAAATGESQVLHFHGTGFTIGTEGYFLSARHVINEECLAGCPTGHSLAGLVLPVDQHQRRWTVAQISAVEAHASSDVAIGKIAYTPPHFFSSRNQVAYGWQDVHVFGYPAGRTRSFSSGLYEFNPHFLKGYVSRRLETKDVSLPHSAPSYELNFPIPLGVSGSPVFRTGPDHSLVGIAVGSQESAVSVHEYTEVQDGGGKYSEKVRKIEQFGIAVRLADLAEWSPRIAGGKRLGELY
jgi:hypothetical protein